MAPQKDTVTLVLGGNVSLVEFSIAIDGMSELMTNLSGEVAPSEKIEWLVEDLRAGATKSTTYRGISINGAVPKVIDAYEKVGRGLERNLRIPFTDKVVAPARRLINLINGNIKTIKFETQERDAIITSAASSRTPSLPRHEPRESTFGAVRGRLDTLARHGQLRFTLYESSTDSAVSCYIDRDHEDRLRKLWGRLVVVEGMIRRDPSTGDPSTIREITEIKPLPENKGDAYLKSRGSIRPKRGRWITIGEALQRVRNG